MHLARKTSWMGVLTAGGGGGGGGVLQRALSTRWAVRPQQSDLNDDSGNTVPLLYMVMQWHAR